MFTTVVDDGLGYLYNGDRALRRGKPTLTDSQGLPTSTCKQGNITVLENWMAEFLIVRD